RSERTRDRERALRGSGGRFLRGGRDGHRGLERARELDGARGERPFGRDREHRGKGQGRAEAGGGLHGGTPAGAAPSRFGRVIVQKIAPRSKNFLTFFTSRRPRGRFR